MPKILKYQTPSAAIPALSPITTNASTSTPTLAGSYQLGQMSNYDIQKRDNFYRQAFNRSYNSFNKLSADKQQQLQQSYINKNISGGYQGKSLFNPNGAGAIGEIMNIANNAIFSNSDSNRSSGDQLAFNARSGISDTLVKSGDPIAMAIGLAAKAADGIMDATGIRSNQITKDAKEKAGITGAERFINNAMNFIPGNPFSIGGKKISDAELSRETEKIRGAYTGTLEDIDSAQSMGGSRVNFMLGSARNKMNNFVLEQNTRNRLLSDISRTNTLRKQSDYAQELNKQNINRYSGNNYQNTAIGKEGLKLPDREMLDALYAKKVTTFKDGGVIGVDSNVIPEGALHRELNHMEEYNEELDKVITDKGIAVVTTDKDGKVEQVAEIEKEEIVFRLELTKKIEELWHNGSQEAMLKAGKLLVKEIMGNTDDNTEAILDGDN